jgi:hypothetical protein
MCAYVRTFRLPHDLHIGRQFSESSGISNTHSSLGFGILLLLRWIMFVFPMLILRVVGLTERALLVLVIFLGSSLVSWSSGKQSSVAQSTTETEYVAAAPKSYGLCTP